jgi:phosphoribosylaminoimidazolecarboxamide formyltransferase/IMP cyclohydrolase
VIIAPEFDADALAIFGKKKNLRLMRAKVGLRADTLREVRAVIGGVLVQDRDQKPVNPRDFKVVTKRQPTADEMTAMLFGWRVVRHVKSSAIVYRRQGTHAQRGRRPDVAHRLLAHRGLEGR